MHPNAMSHREVIEEAERLLAEHNLSETVKVRMNPRLLKVYGRVCWTRPTWTLEMSSKLVDANDREETLNTIRHEVAHAIAGPHAKHGPAWRAACRLTGARPERCYTSDAVNAVNVAWIAECTGCGKEIGTWTREPKFTVRYHRPTKCDTRRRHHIVYIEKATGRRVDPKGSVSTAPKLDDPFSYDDLIRQFGFNRAVPAAASAPAAPTTDGVDTCKHGHEMDEANTYTDPRGSKVCRQCKRDAAARHKAKKEANR